MIQMSFFTEETHRCRDQVYGCRGGWGRQTSGRDREFGRVHSAIFKVDNQQGSTVAHREFCSMLCGSLDGREVLGEMDTYICMAESLCCSPEIITTLLIAYTPI